MTKSSVNQAVPTPEPESRTARLYSRYGAVIFGRCRRILRDEAAAEDATQEVFLRVMRHIASAPDDAAALPWLYRICTNYCLNHLRDRKRFTDAVAVAQPESRPDYERQAVNRDLAQRVMNAATPKLGQAAVLHHVEGLKQAQVASSLGVCRRTVIYRLREFQDEARKVLGDEGRQAA